jgi:hypothetical protein
MNDDQRPFPCCDLLTEARLDGHELIYDLSKITYYLKQSVKCGDYDGDEESSLNYAKQAKEQICTMINSLMKIRDKITFWQAWASDLSPLK